jgi:hypothetical protein
MIQRLVDFRTAAERLGGPARLAEPLEVGQSAVRNWIMHNSLPARLHTRFLMLCEISDIYWRPPGWDLRMQLRFTGNLRGVIVAEAGLIEGDHVVGAKPSGAAPSAPRRPKRGPRDEAAEEAAARAA